MDNENRREIRPAGGEVLSRVAQPGAAEPNQINGEALESRNLLEPAEALIAEGLGGANLIGIAEGVDPSLLFRTPEAIPLELETHGAGFGNGDADVVRAPRVALDRNALERNFRVRFEESHDETQDFYGGGAWIAFDQLARDACFEAPQGVLERLGGG